MRELISRHPLSSHFEAFFHRWDWLIDWLIDWNPAVTRRKVAPLFVLISVFVFISVFVLISIFVFAVFALQCVYSVCSICPAPSIGRSVWRKVLSEGWVVGEEKEFQIMRARCFSTLSALPCHVMSCHAMTQKELGIGSSALVIMKCRLCWSF